MTAIVKHRIEGTRITVWDVYQYTIADWSDEQILGVLPISLVQLHATKRYIDENRDVVHEGHLRIEERNARGNSPEVEEKLKQSRAKIEAWREQKRAANRSKVGDRP